MFQPVLRGALAGAAGTTALNATTYLDMAVRGRSPSSLPEQAVDKLAQDTGHPIPGAGETHEHRVTGLGSLGGIATGVGIGAAAGLLAPVLTRLPSLLGGALLGAAAMAATDVPLKKLGLTDPTRWSAEDWVSDAAPHFVYGFVTALTARKLRTAG